MKKRFLSTLMALVLALSLVPTAALAVEGNIPEEEPIIADENARTNEENTATPVLGANGSYADINAALASGETSVTLTDDATFTALILTDGQTLTIDLAGHTLQGSDGTSTYVRDGAQLTIYSSGTQGNLVIENFSQGSDAAICVETGSSVRLENVNYETDGTGLFPYGNAAAVSVENCSITGNGYCVATNAETTDNYDVVITLTNSTFTAQGTPVCINIPGQLSMDGCTLSGETQGMIVRGGTVVIKNSTITNTMDDDSLADYFNNRDWGSGNTVTIAALTVGNKSNA